MQEGKVIIWGGFTNSWGKKGGKKQRRKGKVHPTKWRVIENSKERQEVLFNEQCKEIEENKRKGKTIDLFKKIVNIERIFHS